MFTVKSQLNIAILPLPFRMQGGGKLPRCFKRTFSHVTVFALLGVDSGKLIIKTWAKIPQGERILKDAVVTPRFLI